MKSRPFVIALSFMLLGAAHCIASAAEPASSPVKPAATFHRVPADVRNGERLLRQHRYADAQASFEHALSKTPGFLPAQIGLARALYGLGKYTDALTAIEKANVQLNELGENAAAADRQSLRIARGRIFHQLRRYEEAAAELSAAIDCRVGSAEAYACRANALDAMGKTQGAIDDISKAIQIDPTDANRFVERALLYRSLGKTDEALADLDSAVKLQPSLVTFRASFNRDRGQNDAALQDYTQAIDLKSGNDKATQYFNRGVIFADIDQHRKAVEDFTDAIEIDPTNAEYFAHRATSYFGVCDFKQAIADYSKAIALDSKDADFYFRRANAYEADAQLKNALADFDQAISLDGGKHALFLAKRAELKSEMGDHPGAVADISKAIDLSKESEDYYLHRGIEYIAAGQLQKSIDDLTHYITSDPNSASAYKSRAIAKAQLGDAAGAIDDFQKSAELYRKEGDRHNVAEVNRQIARLKR